MPRSRSRSRSSSSSVRRSRSPLTDHDSDHERTKEYRVHIAELPSGVQDNEIRKVFQRFGTIIDIWIANASCFAFVVYKYKEDAQKAIDQMDGRLFADNCLRVTWARPRTKNRSHRNDPNMRCYKCGQRGHFSRECTGQKMESRPSRRRDNEYARYPAGFGGGSYSRARSPYSPARLPPVPPVYLRHSLPMYPPFSRRFDPYLDGYYPPMERPNGHDYRYRDRDRGTRLTPPSASARYNRR